MGTKLYPPIIDGVLPAFYLNYDSSLSFLKTTTITVPFTMNSAVSEVLIKGFSLRLRTVSSGTYLFEPIFSDLYNLIDNTVTFTLSPTLCRKLMEGLYYKLLIAYCATRVVSEAGVATGTDIGYYSTVGVIKCVSKPTVSIKGMSLDTINFFHNEFVGEYDVSKCKDLTEKVYSCRFVIYDDNENECYNSGELLHKTIYDTEYTSSIDRVSVNDFMSNDSIYTIQYEVTTLNGLEISSPKYKITNAYLVSPNAKISVLPESVPEYGYVDVKFKGTIDKDRSLYYILNEDALKVVETDPVTGEITSEGIPSVNLLQYIKMVTRNLDDRLLYMKQYSLYRRYPYGIRNNPSNLYYYTFKLNVPTGLTQWGDYYYDTEIYNNIMEHYADGVYTDENLESMKYTTDCYERILWGSSCVKVLSVREVEENYIDLDARYVLRYDELEYKYYGSYLLSRASDADNYSTWYNLNRFKWIDEYPSSAHFRDFTVEHGRKYKYALLQYNLWGLYSARMESEPYMANFEDAYLYDGEKSLRIRYNPEVSSFKTTILELKTDTIGGKYPFITRNGYTYYKEFPVGGLLAAELDDVYSFIDPEFGDTHRHSTPDAAEILPKNAYRNYHFYSDENIALEKDFKIKVLEWLNNGKPKMFKSPYEGNYIVRLLNNSLSPVKELGRLLHSFSSTAYEIAEYNYDNLIAFGFLTTNAPTDYMGLWKGFNLSEYSNDIDIVLDLEGGVLSFTILDMMPGDIIYLTIVGEDSELPIMIGVTGSYSYENIGAKVTKIRIPQREDHSKITGMVNCYYEGIRITSFDSIIGMLLKTIHSRLFVGVSPWAESIKRKPSTSIGSMYSFGLNTDEYNELYNYNFRDYLDTVVTKSIVPGTNGRKSTITYTLSDNFFNLVRSFDPGEILDLINLTLNQGEVYKTQLVNIEMLRFQLRECIPVYAFETYNVQNVWGEYKSPLYEKDLKYSYYRVLDLSIVNKENYRDFFVYDASKRMYVYPDKYDANRDYYERAYDPSSRVLMVSTSPYGYPYPIEELTKIEMLDPFCIFKVLKKEPKDNNWVPVTGNEDTCYYDPYYRTWLPTKYNPTVKINYQWKKLAMLKRELNEETGEYELTPSSQAFYDTNLENQERLMRKDRGEYITEPIDEHAMYDYELYRDDAGKYYYNSPQGIIYIDEPDYNLFIKQNNDLYFACRDTEPDYEKTYWVKYYDVNLNLETEKNIEYTALKNINSISMGNGVVAEVSFLLRVIDYYTEIFNSEVAEAKDEYLTAKNFYTTLMSVYRTIAGADSERRKNYALKELYYRLLYGNKKYMTADDINSVKGILGVESEKEDLKLLVLYNLERMNSGLDMQLLDQMVEFKNKSLNLLKKEDRYNLQYAKLYDIIDTDDSVITTVIDLSYEDCYIIDLNTAGAITKVRAGTEYQESLDKTKTLYRLIDAASGKDYYYLVNKSILVTKYQQASPNTLENELIVTTTIPITVNSIVQCASKTDYMLSDGGSLIEEYTLNTSLDMTVKEQRLLNKEELAAVKLDPYFVHIEPVVNENERFLNEESEIRTVLNLGELQGAVNKLKAISYEVDQFKNQLADLNGNFVANSESYVKSYKNLLEEISKYNQKCYEYWCASLIKYEMTQNGRNRSYLLSLFLYNASNNRNDFYKGEEEALLAFSAGTNLYDETQKAIDDVKLYTRMIDESVEDSTSSLDTHLAKQIEEKKVWALIGLLGIYETLSAMNSNMNNFYELYHDSTGTFETRMQSLVNSFNELASKYTLIRNLIINSSNNINTSIYSTSAIENTLRSFASNYTSRKTRELANLGALNPLDIENFALISIYYDDMMKIIDLAKTIHKNNILFKKGDYSSNTIKGFNPLTFSYSMNNITDPLSMSSGGFAQALRDMTFDNKVEFTRLKKTTTYYYRKGLVRFVFTFDEVTNNLNVFIFNPYDLSKKFANNLIYNTFFENGLNLNLQSTVSSIYSQISSIGFNIMSSDVSDSSNLETVLAKYLNQDAIIDEYNTLIKSYLVPYNALIKLAKSIITPNNTTTPLETALNWLNWANIDTNSPVLPSDILYLKLNDTNYASGTKKPSTTLWTSSNKNGWPCPLIIDPIVFYECTDTLEDDKLVEYGIYYDYLKNDYEKEIEKLNILLEQALALQYLYQKLLDDYELKYNNYSDLYEYNLNLYMSFFGSEAYNYYNKVNGLGNYSGQNALTQEEKALLLKKYKNDVKLAWYKFLELLDAKYSEEREKGMYK